MGQRLIISESERNRIKGLYENNIDVNEQGKTKLKLKWVQEALTELLKKILSVKK